MIRVNIHEAKTHLSRFLEDVARGETVVICNRNIPVAELRALATQRSSPRPIGLGRGTFQVPRSFFDDLPPALVEGFEGLG